MQRFAFVLFLLPSICFADYPFLCVDPDFREAFLPSYPIQTQYSTDLPDGFIEHAVPRSSVLIGSQANDSYASVIYKTDDDVDLVVDSIVSSL